jgi:2-polyprenyl-3-methyl-5-hydroxy-6-metoxy-1,4-benzoquinol methylase
MTSKKMNQNHLLGSNYRADVSDFGPGVAWNDHKIHFMAKKCRGKSVLDIGCVQHNPENYKSRYWLHKALVQVASELEGIDSYEEGVRYLRGKGFNVFCDNAHNFDRGRVFDIIAAGDVIEHLENFDGFMESCKRHMHADSRLLISTPNPWYWRNVIKATLFADVSNNLEHTCWFCPRTLRQLVNRHSMDIGEIVFGSRYLRDRLMPLPRGLKHTSFHAEIFLVV